MMLLPKLVYLCHLDTFLPAHLNSETKYSRLVKNYPNEEFQGVLNSLVGGSDSKAFVYNVGDPGLIPGLGRSPGEGNGTPLQYFCLEIPMDKKNLAGYSP